MYRDPDPDLSILCYLYCLALAVEIGALGGHIKGIKQSLHEALQSGFIEAM